MARVLVDAEIQEIKGYLDQIMTAVSELSWCTRKNHLWCLNGIQEAATLIDKVLED